MVQARVGVEAREVRADIGVGLGGIGEPTRVTVAAVAEALDVGEVPREDEGRGSAFTALEGEGAGERAVERLARGALAGIGRSGEQAVVAEVLHERLRVGPAGASADLAAHGGKGAVAPDAGIGRDSLAVGVRAAPRLGQERQDPRRGQVLGERHDDAPLAQRSGRDQRGALVLQEEVEAEGVPRHDRDGVTDPPRA